MGIKLFDDGDDDGQNDDISQIEINKNYARRFEYNKKREDLQRYQELKKKGVIAESDADEEEESESDSSSEEDNNDVVNARKEDLEFIHALIKVRNRDPSLKEKDVKLFESDESEEDEIGNDGKKKKEKEKAVYLKDVVAKRLIEEGPELDEEEEDVDNEKKKSYNEEQEEIRKAFLDAAEEDDDDDDEGDLLKEKEKGNDEGGDDGGEFSKKLDEYFGGGDGELDENQMFLKEFFMNKMWVDKEKKDKKLVVDDEEVDELERDEEEIERQEEYECNFRYEENAGDRVMGHSRKVEGSVRKKENARKEQRKSKEERMKISEMEREEDLKHLKNLKKQEIDERMRKVMEIAGIKEEDEFVLKAKDLEDEFDPEAYDKLMKAVYNDEYYGAEDVNPAYGEDGDEDWDEVEKPDFEKEDELLGLPKGWDVLESTDGFLAARERSLKHKLEKGGEGDYEGEEEVKEEKEEETKEGKRKRKRKMSLVKRAQEEMMEEYYKLDYEDTIGDLKTRFKYAKIKPNKYGLSTKEILMMDEKELNQYVSLKMLAPYREREWKVPGNKISQQKMRNKELLQGGKLDVQKTGNKKRLRDGSDQSTSVMGNEDGKVQVEESNGDMGKISRSAKRRRRQAGLKLSQSRLIAYGKITPKKDKGKH